MTGCIATRDPDHLRNFPGYWGLITIDTVEHVEALNCMFPFVAVMRKFSESGRATRFAMSVKPSGRNAFFFLGSLRSLQYRR